ncbi:hypothetical protein [Brevundimonas sp.]|uniref:hypothetical protein n=1 Tax=Brevundimonas sp. TaxID=1871086 RepID=UPI001D2E9C3B|nr:hypothetical protein [Brevundimonas sp.]MBL0947572.1 hypothetical protein [Brevundimonas sp.]
MGHASHSPLKVNLLSSLLLATALLAFASSTAHGQDARARADAYLACPAAGIALWIPAPRRAPSPPDDPTLIVMERDPIDVRWAGDDDWIDPPAVPKEVLSEPETWIRPVSVREEHEAVRRQAVAEFPAGSPSVLLFQRTEHWAWHSESTVAVRFPDGSWRVDYVQRYDDGTVRRDQRTLDSEASRRMDELVSDPCLAREPFVSEFAHVTSSDNTRWTLEVDDGSLTTRIAGRDSGFGRAGAIIYLLRGGTAF